MIFCFCLLEYKRKLSISRKAALKRHRNRNKLKQRRKRHIEKEQYFVLPIMKIPCEIFMEICTYLSPSDLLSLTRVCKGWRKWLIALNNNFIWKESRMMFMRCIKDPPINVDESNWYIQKWKNIPYWVHNCFFCFNVKARKSCRYKGSLIRVCKHCHNIYSHQARKKVSI